MGRITNRETSGLVRWNPGCGLQPHRAAQPASTDDLPHGIDFSRAQWVDLDGEGLSGLLTEAGGGWWYKRNESEGRRGAWRQLPSRPGVALRDVQLGYVDGDGRLEVSVRGSSAGLAKPLTNSRCCGTCVMSMGASP